jgi:copper oxidase (laccase) domain-containing protein
LKIAEKAVVRMEEVFGTTPQDVLAGIGPSIGPEDYEVGMDVVEAVREAFPENWKNLVSEKGGSHYLDLWATNELVLRSSGVTQIEIAGISTYSQVSDWFSHRRELGKTGRFAALITVPGVVE